MTAEVSPSASVLALVEEFEVRLADSPAGAAFSGVRKRLTQPLRVAVAGRLKSGKSTLVNALLRQRVAPVDVGECTKVVTWFRYGAAERVEVVPRDGGRSWTLTLTPEGMLPADLGAPADQIERVEVALSNSTLEHLTIIDTPGLDSLDAASSEATEDVLGLGADSRAAVGQADALIFLLTRLSDRDVERLSAVSSLFADSVLSETSTIAVLSKADKISDSADPIGAARHLARRFESRLGRLVSAVVPVVGLLAEAADADGFTGSDAANLGRLAQLGPQARAEFLLSADWFLDSDELPVARADRERLLTVLDLFGLSVGLDAADRLGTDTPQLVDVLRDCSGMSTLRDLVDSTFRFRADLLKAHAALIEMERLSYTPALNAGRVGERLRSEVERLRASGTMHRIAELEAARAVSTGRATLDAALAGELHSLVLGRTRAERLGLHPDAGPDECHRAALDLARRWRSLQNDPRTPVPTARVAATVVESLMILWEDGE